MISTRRQRLVLLKGRVSIRRTVSPLRERLQQMEKDYLQLRINHSVTPLDNPAQITADRRMIARSHESFGRTLTFTHSDFGRLLGDGLVGEDTDPDLTLTLHRSTTPLRLPPTAV